MEIIKPMAYFTNLSFAYSRRHAHIRSQEREREKEREREGGREGERQRQRDRQTESYFIELYYFKYKQQLFKLSKHWSTKI